MKWNLIRRLAMVGALGVLAAGALYVSGIGARATSTIAALGRLGPGTIGAALVLSTLSALLSGALWWRLIQRLGYRTPFRTALMAHLNAGLAGYVVNIVGPALGSVASLRRHGIGPGRAVLLMLIANALGFSGILLWAPVGLLLLSRTGMDSALPILGRHGPVAAAVVLAAMAVAMLLVLRALASAAGSKNRLARMLLGRMRTTEDGAPPALRYQHVLSLVPYSALSWVVGALALYVVLVAMSHGAGLTLGAVIGAAVLAAALGSLAFFAPEGVGVKDGALVALLTHATGLPVTTCVAAALAVRALDPVTKLSLLGVLAVTANPAVSRLLTGATPWLRGAWISPWRASRPGEHAAPRLARWAYARRGSGLVAVGRRSTALLGAGMLALVLVVSSRGVLARADKDVTSPRDGTRPAFFTTVYHGPNRLAIADVGVPPALVVFRVPTEARPA